jgi:L-alanine-DL-glutamate epimerase-like enolase superfamily enzyme
VRRWDADGHQLVRRGIKAAVATGENLTGLEQYRPLLAAQGVDIVQAGSVWGITHFLRVAALAHAYDLAVSPVGYHTNPLAAASTALPNVIAIEVQNLEEPLGISVDHTIVDGGLVLGDTPGSGLVVDESAIGGLVGASWSTAQGPHVRSDRAGLRLTQPT